MAFPTTSVLDNFTGTNGDNLPVYSANWLATPTGGTDLEIQGNAATGTVIASNNVNGWNADFGPDSEVFCTVTTNPADGEILLLLCRLEQATSLLTVDGYSIQFAPVAGTDGLQLQRIDDGVATNLGASISQEVGAGDGIGLLVVGSTLRAYYKASAGSWGQVGSSQTDTTYTAAGKIAPLTNSTTVRFDDFGGGTADTGADASISGSSTVTGTGASTATSNASASGVGTLTGTGSSIAASNIDIAGESSVTGTGASIFSAAMSSDGQATLQMVGEELISSAATMSISGESSLIAEGQSTAQSDMSIDGISTMIAVGDSGEEENTDSIRAWRYIQRTYPQERRKRLIQEHNDTFLRMAELALPQLVSAIRLRH